MWAELSRSPSRAAIDLASESSLAGGITRNGSGAFPGGHDVYKRGCWRGSSAALPLVLEMAALISLTGALMQLFVKDQTGMRKDCWNRL
jgi:hypothetical protein